MILANLPNQLYGIYDRFLETFEGEDLVYLERILRWLLFSAEPISLPQLEDALAFDFSDPHLHVYDPAKRGNKAIILCGFLEGLVIVAESLSTDDDMSKVASLAHASVADYLVSDKFATKAGCNLNSKHSHTFLAQSCVSYLLHFENHLEKKFFTLLHLAEQISSGHPLAKYAAQYWSYHLLRCHDRAVLSISTARLLVGDSSQYAILNNLYQIEGQIIPPPPLYMCSLIGYHEGVEYLLRNGADANAVGGRYRNALQAASAKGHTNIICTLLGHGADMNMAGGQYGNALQAAAACGHADVICALLENGADINEVAGTYGTALQAAAACGHADLVCALLENGADINKVAGTSGSALQAAAARGHTEVVGILIEKGANINNVGGDYGSALQAAATHCIPRPPRLS
jgi:hypothetical protein